MASSPPSKRASPGVPRRFPRKHELAASAVLLSVVAFVASLAVAMARYPGGTWRDRSAPGHDFFGNFLCDLTSERALGGALNPGARLATGGMLALSLGLAPFWWLVPRFFADRLRLGSAVRSLGLASSLALVAVPLMPSSRWGVLHAITIFVAGVPALAASILATRGLFASPAAPRSARLFAAATLGIGAFDGALYSVHVASGGAPPFALPALQRLATIALLGWITSTSVAVLRA